MAAPFLIKRRAGWYLRIRIPAELALLLGSHLTRTLETRDYGLARRRAILAAARLQTCWQEAWRAMDRETYESIVENLRRRDRLRLQTELQRLNAALKTNLTAEMEAAVRSWEGPVPQAMAPKAGEVSTLPAEERLKAKLEGMQEALAMMMTPAPLASATQSPPQTASVSSGLRPEAETAWPDLIDALHRPPQHRRTGPRQPPPSLSRVGGADRPQGDWHHHPGGRRPPRRMARRTHHRQGGPHRPVTRHHRQEAPAHPRLPHLGGATRLPRHQSRRRGPAPPQDAGGERR